MSRKYDFAVFIGRMQPIHKGHLECIKRCLQIADKAIILFGSHGAARNIRNPWTTAEREEMVRACFSKEDQERFVFTSANDWWYRNNNWLANVQEKVNEAVGDMRDPERGKYARIVLVGSIKDQDSGWMNDFPQWGKEITPTNENLHATEVRNIYFNKSIYFEDTSIAKMLELPVIQFLRSWQTTSTSYARFTDEWEHINEYKEMWAKAPYPVTFCTTDAVVVKSGHVLMVRRKMKYGKGLLALPGGFIKQELSVIDSALEELKEETRIKVSKEVLMRNLKDEKVFDYPGRSLRGRTITHAYYFELPAGGELPYVKGDDDAEKALWIPITELYSRSDEIFEDHLHIVDYFYSKPR